MNLFYLEEFRLLFFVCGRVRPAFALVCLRQLFLVTLLQDLPVRVQTVFLSVFLYV